MTLIERQAPSHWYLPDGRPFHEVPKKDGSGNRPVTLRDARQVLAFPSVTNVLSVLAKPGLDAWKIEQGIMAALTLPRLPDEALDDFARRVVKDMGEQVDKAADFGTAIHRACELYVSEKVCPSDPMLLRFFEPWRAWCDANVECVGAVETVVVERDLGYGGRVDMLAKLKGIGWSVVDFKTQKVKRSARGEPKPSFYESWPLQLAAYAEPLRWRSRKPVEAIVSVVIDSAEPGPVHVKVWEDLPKHYEYFLLALQLWKYCKGYDPVLPEVGGRPEVN